MAEDTIGHSAIGRLMAVIGKAARYLWRFGPAAFVRKVDERFYAFRTTKFGPAHLVLRQAYYVLLRAALPDPSSPEYVPLAASSIAAANLPVGLIAFYLPQFHPIPENDAWWGKGFTEWTNTTKAVPQFLGHSQPHLPGELGFYDLRVPEVQRRQVELARQYGIQGFAFYYYWFNGKRLLQRPLEQFVSDPEINFPYCICWANESWTRRWDNNENEVLIRQEHTEESDASFIRDVERFLQDPRYIRIGGKPILIVYRVELLPDPRATAAVWRQHCRRAGIGEIYLIAAQTYGFEDPRPAGFDAAVEFPPHNFQLRSINRSLKILNPWYAGSIYDYREFAAQYAGRPSDCPYELFKTVSPAWDNEPRKPANGTSFAFSTPAEYQKWLTRACEQALAKEPDRRVVFINAWNEWAEGAYLEPDRRFGYAYLQATMDALRSLAQAHV
jgi:lipopolysaccharide biosynthesis protein